MSKVTRPTRSQKAPARDTPVLSPPPPMATKKIKKTPVVKKKAAVSAKKRGSLGGLPVKIDRLRRAQKSEPEKVEAEEEGQDDIGDLEKEALALIEEVENKMEDVIEEADDQEIEQEVVVKKAGRSRAAKTKVEAKSEAKDKKITAAPKTKTQPAPKKTRPKKHEKIEIVDKTADKTFVIHHSLKPSETKFPDEEIVEEENELENEKYDDEEMVLDSEVKDLENIQNASLTRAELDFTKIKFTRLIDESMVSKSITFEGTYLDEVAVVRLERLVFDENISKKALIDKDTHTTRNFVNDIYSSYIVDFSKSVDAMNNVKATVVWPANEKVLAKYSRSEKIFVHESPDMYSKIVQPYIENLLASDKDYNNWVYNILDGKSEHDRVIFNDTDPNSGFILAQDLNWSGDEKDVNLLAICHSREIRSLRDLSDKHLTLLKNIMTKGTKVIKDKYKKVKGQMRSYIHYHPSFYHFHVHFKMVDPSEYITTDRDNLLSTVINNITLNKDYYKKSTLTYPLAISSALYQELKRAKKV